MEGPELLPHAESRASRRPADRADASRGACTDSTGPTPVGSTSGMATSATCSRRAMPTITTEEQHSRRSRYVVGTQCAPAYASGRRTGRGAAIARSRGLSHRQVPVAVAVREPSAGPGRRTQVPRFRCRRHPSGRLIRLPDPDVARRAMFVPARNVPRGHVPARVIACGAAAGRRCRRSRLHRGAPSPDCLDPGLVAQCASAALERDGTVILVRHRWRVRTAHCGAPR